MLRIEEAACAMRCRQERVDQNIIVNKDKTQICSTSTNECSDGKESGESSRMVESGGAVTTSIVQDKQIHVSSMEVEHKHMMVPTTAAVIIDERAVEVSPYYNEEDLNTIRDKLIAFDAMRDEVIKISRDIQKYSKQAIFCVHAKNYSEAQSKLQSAEVLALDIFKTYICKEKSLRSGSFTNSLEEWVEGKLFLEYQLSKKILSREELSAIFPITTVEYIGGLSDLTGELGRIAVNLASSKEISAMYDIFDTLYVIQQILGEFNSIGTGRYSNKYKSSSSNVTKVELLLYELRMAQSNGSSGDGGKYMSSWMSVGASAPEGGGGDQGPRKRLKRDVAGDDDEDDV